MQVDAWHGRAGLGAPKSGRSSHQLGVKIQARCGKSSGLCKRHGKPSGSQCPREPSSARTEGTGTCGKRVHPSSPRQAPHVDPSLHVSRAPIYVRIKVSRI